jgi:hypothetical protein
MNITLRRVRYLNFVWVQKRKTMKKARKQIIISESKAFGSNFSTLILSKILNTFENFKVVLLDLIWYVTWKLLAVLWNWKWSHWNDFLKNINSQSSFCFQKALSCFELNICSKHESVCTAYVCMYSVRNCMNKNLFSLFWHHTRQFGVIHNVFGPSGSKRT